MLVCTLSARSRTGGAFYFFFFQAEDGIRDLTVTGVQTCALPISPPRCGPCAGPAPPAPSPSCRLPLPLPQNGLDARDLAPQRPELQRVRDRLRRALERQTEALVGQDRELLLQLVGRQLPQRLGLLPRHPSAPPASRTST